MKSKLLLVAVFVLLLFVFVSCLFSEISWSSRERTLDPVRQIVGLPSVAIGNLNPVARNPGLEILCTGLYDVPGGYCPYFVDGVSFFNFVFNETITVSGK